LLAHAAAFVLVVRHGAAPVRRARLQAKACLLFVEVAPDERCLAEGLHPDVEKLRALAASLDRSGYLRPPLVRGGRMSELAAAGGVCSDAYGHFKVGERGVGGRALLPRRGGEPADAVVLARGPSEEDQTAFALARPGGEEGVGEAAGDWLKALPPSELLSGGRLTAWAFDAEAGRAYKLCGEGTPRPRE
jgi:hypothetical protein